MRRIRAVRGVRRGRHHAARHDRRPVRRLDRRAPGADARTRAAGAATTSPRRARRGAASASASGMVRRLGARLAKEGYRGFFEVDFLVDRDTGEHLPRRAQPARVGPHADHPRDARRLRRRAAVPLPPARVLDVDYEIDVDEINARWSRLGADDVWSQLIVKETADRVELLTATPQTGIYRSRATGWCACGRPRLAQPARRGRGLLPARAGARRLPLQGRRPRRDRRARADAGRRPRADAALPAVGAALRGRSRAADRPRADVRAAGVVQVRCAVESTPARRR